MKVLICYTTKHGAVYQIAEKLAAQLPEARLCNLKTQELPDPDAYDCIVLGSSITAGQMSRRMKDFISVHRDLLKRKRLGLFLSALTVQPDDLYLKESFGELYGLARAKGLLGGIYDPSKCSLFEQFIMKVAARQNTYLNTIDEERIAAFVLQLTSGPE